ncbi:hypothetical protein DVK02_02120 [Halobellus sp. Atlit-31R]|nr:hypothetical protein DVK02_02120 [Halobellus sp. Atlit-31R]
MIRIVVAAMLAVATLAAVVPAVDHARAKSTDATIESAVDRFERAGRTLATTEDATTKRSWAATRRVTVRLPRRSLTAARPAFVAVGGRPGGPGNRSVVAFALASSPTRLRGLSLPIPIRTPAGPVVVREPGRTSVSLALVRQRGRGGPELFVAREPPPTRSG